MMEEFILAAFAVICVALYFIWRTQLEILRVLRLLNVKFLNGALFLRQESESETVPKEERKPN